MTEAIKSLLAGKYIPFGRCSLEGYILLHADFIKKLQVIYSKRQILLSFTIIIANQ